MGTLPDFRTWLRTDLSDPAGATQRFSDPDLSRAVTRAVAELSLAWPRLTDNEVTLASASRTVPLPVGTFPGLIDVHEVEWPYGAGGIDATIPPTLPPFRLSVDRGTVTLLTPEVPPAGARLRLRWSSPHTIAEVSTTIPTDLDLTIATGAAGYAMLAYSTPAADNFSYQDGAAASSVDDSMIPKEWRTRAQACLAQFRADLERLRRRRLREGTRTVAWGAPYPDALWPVTVS